jgi:hypothetical protein
VIGRLTTGAGNRPAERTEGIDYEIKFWDKWFRTNGGEWPQTWTWGIQKQKNILDHQRFFFAPNDPNHCILCPDEPGRTKIKILDTGAGPISIVGNWHPTFEIELIPTDPLAKLYNNLSIKYNIEITPRTQYCRVEDIKVHFPENFFDIAHINNALDHAEDPVDGIRQMLMVVKHGGTVVRNLHHHSLV